MKILNLYACLGGNRYKWGDEHEITAVELDPELARMYQERFPNDTVIVADAHQYLLDHYQEYNKGFVWSSPPCPNNSRANFWGSRSVESRKKVFPDLTLYQESIFLEHWFDGRYCIENVIPYYEPLIPAKKRGRHLYWTNFNLPSNLNEREIQIGAGDNEVKRLCEFHDYDFYQYKGNQRLDKIARNLVDYEAGKTILDTAMNIEIQSKDTQSKLF